ncbi:aromatic ring-hydroxylating dioxygenase subunit alpha [Telmatospirillum sp. J64-1]|uniref:aromatic ring-hydroxylating dioxygenase subunit alpha n=1 Tax=Telmatospirillum sp. J64-1 TaxID=2502183 RepID=UPI00115E238D|nr:aromatic ring-hydroxylating dioxygenase subunit alpha [Telmatospirillum sp. J64-1]
MNNISTVAEKPKIYWEPNEYHHVPYQIYSDGGIYEEEQKRLFRGPVWQFVGLDMEVPNPGDFKTTWIGDTPILLIRDETGALNAFVNRCAHRGTTLCFEAYGNKPVLSCVYHNWCFDLQGNLQSVAFQHGIRKQGGLPKDFCFKDHGLTRLRVAQVRNLVFATFSDETPPIEEFLGETMVSHMNRIFNRPMKILGTYSQYMHNNWKLYMENVKDSYHASLLHLFFTTFRLNRLSMEGGLLLDDSGGHHISYSKVKTDSSQDTEYETGQLRAQQDDFTLADRRLLRTFPEFEDGITHAIQGIFPTMVVQQIQNSLAVRQLVPRGPGECELFWTILGYEDDTPDQTDMRLKQSNLIGPAGLVSMEDGIIGSLVQRAIDCDSDKSTVLEMGGHSVENQKSRVSEASVRGFWKAYRTHMDL